MSETAMTVLFQSGFNQDPSQQLQSPANTRENPQKPHNPASAPELFKQAPPGLMNGNIPVVTEGVFG